MTFAETVDGVRTVPEIRLLKLDIFAVYCGPKNKSDRMCDTLTVKITLMLNGTWCS